MREEGRKKSGRGKRKIGGGRGRGEGNGRNEREEMVGGEMVGGERGKAGIEMEEIGEKRKNKTK